MINTMADEAVKLMNLYGKSEIPFFFLIDFELQKPVVLPWTEAAQAGIHFSFGELQNENPKTDYSEITIQPLPTDYEVFQNRFNKAIDALHRGDAYLLNLTAKTQIQTSASLNQIFCNTKSKYKLLFNNEFVCFSPETFVTIFQDKINTYPMKGTIQNKPGALQKILNDAKELAEHITVVDLLRNDLSQIAVDVAVPNFRYPTFIKSQQRDLIQLSTRIEATLTPHYKSNLGDAIFKLLPAGSVSGAPKPKVLQIIQELEKEPRGYYCGVAGAFNGTRLESCVLIRYIEIQNGILYYRSGGGITAQSSCSSEYQELLEKIYVPSL